MEGMTRILAVADEVEPAFYSGASNLSPDLVVACGDLPSDYLEHIASSFAVPLLYVFGNHDTNMNGMRPRGCTCIDGRIADAAGLRVAGLGGSVRYRPGPHQYTQAKMRWRALGLEIRGSVKKAFDGKGIDVVATHAPPFRVGDEPDPPHHGFKSFHRLVDRLTPKILVHGHVHRHGLPNVDRHMGQTLVVNAVGHRWIEVSE
jgi:Icc-related predicted phosphoesterase